MDADMTDEDLKTAAEGIAGTDEGKWPDPAGWDTVRVAKWALQLLAERDKLRAGLALAAIPLEVLTHSEATDGPIADISPTLRAGIAKAVTAVRATLLDGKGEPSC